MPFPHQMKRKAISNSSNKLSICLQELLWEHFPKTKKMYGNIVPTPLHPGHVTSTICRDSWLGFKSLWLGFRIRAYGQGVVSIFKLRGSVFRVKVWPTVHLVQTRSC